MPEVEEAAPPAKDKDKEKVKKKRTSVKKVKDKEKTEQTDEVLADGEKSAETAEGEVAPSEAPPTEAPPAEPEQPARPETPEVQDVIVEYQTNITDIAKKIAEKQGKKDLDSSGGGGMKELCEKKLLELREVFKMLDQDEDGIISEHDLKKTFSCLGQEIPTSTIKDMLSEAYNPLNFDAFVILIGYRTIEMDPEEVLLSAWSRWDPDYTGGVPEPKMYHDLMTWGEKFTEKEASAALKEAPMLTPSSYKDPPMIDYVAFCKTLCGLRKPRARIVKRM